MEKRIEKRKLAILGSPLSFLQFLKYYCSNSNETIWDVLVMPFGKNKHGEWEYRILEAINRVGIFSDIKIDNTTYIDKPLIKKIRKVLEVFGACIVGKRVNYCRRQVNERIDVCLYCEIVMPWYQDLLYGEVMNLASEGTKVVLLEDGMRDYVEHTKLPRLEYISRVGIVNGLVGYFFCLLKYADPSNSLFFKPTKKCIKYSTYPDYLIYRDYKEIHSFNELERGHDKQIRNLIKRAYDLHIIEEDIDVILFTTPLEQDGILKKDEINKIVGYIEEEYAGMKILIKKHPRDNTSYSFRNNISIVEAPSDMPGEVLVEYVHVNKYIFMWSSALIMCLHQYDSLEILVAKDAYTSYYCKDTIEDDLKFIDKSGYSIVEI